MTQPVQPIYILPKETERNTGKNAQRNNIMAAKLVAETVRTTLGPKGMDKMLVDSLGDVVAAVDDRLATIVEVNKKYKNQIAILEEVLGKLEQSQKKNDESE